MVKDSGRLMDDLARVAGGAVNVISGIRQQVQNDVRARVDDMAVRMDLVPREDFIRLESLVASLEKRIAALESSSGNGPDQQNATKTEKSAKSAKTGSRKTKA